MIKREANDTEIESHFIVHPDGRIITIDMTRWHWKALEWTSKNRGVTSGYILHHAEYTNFKDWHRLSDYFMWFIEDIIKWEKEQDRRGLISYFRCDIFTSHNLSEKWQPTANSNIKKLDQ